MEYEVRGHFVLVDDMPEEEMIENYGTNDWETVCENLKEFWGVALAKDSGFPGMKKVTIESVKKITN